MIGPPKESDFWAKLKYRDDDRSTGEIVAWHPLLAHSADVAAVTEALLQRTILRQRLAQLIGWEDVSDIHIARLSALAAMHDAGKVNHGFQNRAFGKKPAADHVRPIINFLESGPKELDLSEALRLQEMVSWFGSVGSLRAWLFATWGHHGRPVQTEKYVEPSFWPDNAIADLREFAANVYSWFPDIFGEAEPFPADPVLQHTFNGTLTLADWIGSDTRFFRFDQPEDRMPYSARQDSRERAQWAIDIAKKRAKSAVEKLFLSASSTRISLPAHVGFDKILEAGLDPYPIQKACLELPLYVDGSLTILESDTGSGKTEAAVARYFRLFQEGLVDGMYFAVPTRSAATELHSRVTDAVKRVFPEEKCPPVVQAVPGQIKADHNQAVRLEGFKVQWDVEDDYRGWAAENSKRYLAAPIAVGTIDQVLMSTLQVSHAHMRSAALLRHLLVIDEVHASDVYMTALQDLVLDYHLSSGGHAFLMSATLSASARTHLSAGGNDDPPPLTKAKEIPYPLVTNVDSKRDAPEFIHATSSGYEKQVTATAEPIAGDYQAVVEAALTCARAGAQVLIIRNRVKDCVALQLVLEDSVGEDKHLLFNIEDTPAPHHSRFSPADRRALDHRIEHIFGKSDYDRSAHGCVAVATQTVEQSLDIDADIMFTDLCPMDVLLQRIGRLHRHPGNESNRPVGYKSAQCIVLTPEERDLTAAIIPNGEKKGAGYNGPHGLGTVYPDLRMIEATWRVMEDDLFSPWSIPRDNRLLVEQATHPERLASVVGEHEAWKKHAGFIFGSERADALVPDLVGLDRSAPFADKLFADIAEKVQTRLGEDYHRVVFPELPKGPFGKAVEELSISERWLRDTPGTEEPSDLDEFAGGFDFEFCGERYRYNSLGLSRLTAE